MAVHEGEGQFRDLVLQDKEILRFLTPLEIDSCFDLGHYTKHVDRIFRRVFVK